MLKRLLGIPDMPVAAVSDGAKAGGFAAHSHLLGVRGSAPSTLNTHLSGVRSSVRRPSLGGSWH